MSKCDNCSSEFNPLGEGLVTTERGRTVAAVCGTCTNGVRVAKIVIRRNDVGGFNYDQWAPMEMMAGGLSSKRAG